MKRGEVVISLILILCSVFLILKNRKEVTSLQVNGVFVLGKLASATVEGEMGMVYTYHFLNKKEYDKSFTWPVKKEIIFDGLLFFNILPEEPSICKQVSDVRVPACLHLGNSPDRGWAEMPTSAICDSIK